MKRLPALIAGAAAATALAGGASAVSLFDAGDARLTIGVYDSAQPPVLEKTQWVWGGRNYCWYTGGWHGPGYYWCGYAWRAGFGWGGPWGWNGWRGGWRGGWHGGWRDRDDWRWRDRDDWRWRDRDDWRRHGWNGHDNGRHEGFRR
jgi:hypothetical protein